MTKASNKVKLTDAQQRDLFHELDWMMDHSEGVVGLNADGTVMPWEKVRELYMPTTLKRWDGWRD